MLERIVQAGRRERIAMSERFVTVATYPMAYEAELAKGLLAREGIESLVLGELSANAFSGVSSFGDQMRLQVHEDDAQRATRILAAQAAHVELEDNWEDEAENATAVCTLCGTALSDDQSVCPTCQTPRDAFQQAVPRNSLFVQTEPQPPLDDEGIQPTPTLKAPGSPAPEEKEEDTPEAPPLPHEKRARGAFLLAALGWICFPLFPLLSVWLLFRLSLDDSELSPKGMRYFYASIVLNGLYFLTFFLLCSGLLLRR
jgi:rubrerythrin